VKIKTYNKITIDHNGVDIDIQEKYENREAEKAYVTAMAEFKINPPSIIKDKFNKQYNSKYSSLGALVHSSIRKMSSCGLTHKWEINQAGETITVTCIATHQQGHSEKVTMSSPPDKSGAKNPIQQIKSTITYLKAVTFESLFGLAATDANMDDDGNGHTPEKVIDNKQVGQILDMINSKNLNLPDFLNWLNVKTVEEIPARQFNRALTALKGAKAK